MGERYLRKVEAVGSIPITSTKKFAKQIFLVEQSKVDSRLNEIAV